MWHYELNEQEEYFRWDVSDVIYWVARDREANTTQVYRAGKKVNVAQYLDFDPKHPEKLLEKIDCLMAFR